jgi:methionyl-tRNA formyltransferase
LLVGREAIRGDDTSASLVERLSVRGADLVLQALRDAASAALVPVPQPAVGVSYAHKLAKSEAAIDWTHPAAEIERRVRAFDPQPGCHFAYEGQSVKLWRARVCAGAGLAPGTLARADGSLRVACGDGLGLELLELQRAGGRRQPVGAFLGGH